MALDESTAPLGPLFGRQRDAPGSAAPAGLRRRVFLLVLAPVISIGPRGQHHDPMTIPVRLGKIAEAVRQWIIADRVDGTDAPIAPVVNSAGRTSPCACAPLTRADLGRPTFKRLQLISRCSIRKDAERKGENRQEANHDQIFPRPRPTTAQRWAGSRDRIRQQPRRFAPAGSFSPKSWRPGAPFGGGAASGTRPTPAISPRPSPAECTVYGGLRLARFHWRPYKRPPVLAATGIVAPLSWGRK
jgi:hypothetical protein